MKKLIILSLVFLTAFFYSLVPKSSVGTSVLNGVTHGTDDYLVMSEPVAQAGVLGDGADDYISITTTAALEDHSSGLTVSFWIKFTSVTDETVISKHDQASPSTNGWVFFIYNSHWYFQLRVDDTCCQGAEAASGPTAGVWYHVVLWWDMTDGKLYVDGTEETNFSATGTLTSTDDIWVLSNVDSGGVYFVNAEVTDLRQYNRALSTTEISELYTSRLKFPFEAGGTKPDACWPMDDQPDGTSYDGDTVIDRCGSSNGTGVDGANNTGLTAKAETYLMHPGGVS